MKPTRKEIDDAAYGGDLDLLRQLAHEGADLNEQDKWGCSLLADIVGDLCSARRPYRYQVVRTLLELGADPNILDEENYSPLTSAMFCMDTEMLQILLEAGADPNKAGGFDQTESFYEWAEFDYLYQVYALELPEAPSEEDEKDTDAWLRFLDRIAVKHKARRPDHLILLRRFGAKTMSELNASHEP